MVTHGKHAPARGKRRQDFRITPYINYAYIYCWKKTKERTILRLWDFSYYHKNFDFFLSLF